MVHKQSAQDHLLAQHILTNLQRACGKLILKTKSNVFKIMLYIFNNVIIVPVCICYFSEIFSYLSNEASSSGVKAFQSFCMKA